MNTLTIAQLRADLKCELKNDLKRAIASHAERLERLEACHLAKHLLAAAGFVVELPNHNWAAQYLNLRVEWQELPKVRAALGAKLIHSGNDVEGDTKKTAVIVVRFHPAGFPGVTIETTKKPPRHRKGFTAPACKIKVQREPARKRLILQCEV